MKTKEELTALKEEVEAVSKKLSELTEDELAQVTGGKYNQDVLDTYQFAYTGIAYSGPNS